MMAAQLIAAHNAAMERYRRAMHSEQTFEGRRENLAQANKLSHTYATLLEALNRHRGKGQQKVTVEHVHVHVHSGGQAVVGIVQTPGGGDHTKLEDHPPCKANCSCTSAGDAARGRGAGAGANRRRCRMAAAACTADDRRALPRVTETLSSMAATPSRRLPAGARSRRSLRQCALWLAPPVANRKYLHCEQFCTAR